MVRRGINRRHCGGDGRGGRCTVCVCVCVWEGDNEEITVFFFETLYREFHVCTIGNDVISLIIHVCFCLDEAKILILFVFVNLLLVVWVHSGDGDNEIILMKN